MKKTLISSILIITCLFIFSACGTPKAETGEVKEVDYDTFMKMLENEKAQPFYFIGTDAKKKTFDKKGKPVYEDYLSQKNEGAIYLNLHDVTDKEIEEINKYSSFKNSEGTGSDYDAREDGMVIVRNNEIEKISTRHVLNKDIYERDSMEEIHNEIKENVEKTIVQSFN